MEQDGSMVDMSTSTDTSEDTPSDTGNACRTPNDYEQTST